jgi:phospholipid transport system substrate-binding protein
MKKHYAFIAFIICTLCLTFNANPRLIAEDAKAKGDEIANADTPPKEKVKTAIDEIIKIVESNSGDAQKDARREKLRELINPLFDFDEMAKRSLGINWKEATPEEQQEFTKVFSDLLARTYLSKIETVKPGMVAVNSETVDQGKAMVKTMVTHKGDTFPLDYKLQNTSGKWRVYDVVIENIGLVANYRNEFAGVVRKEKVAGLIQKLKDKKPIE